MNTRYLAILLLVGATVSCDKVKSLATKAATAVNHKIASKAAAGETSTVDAELQKLVDQTPEGTLFRKDLPFPTHLEVRSTRCDEMDLRISESSAIEKRTEVVKGSQTTITKLERSGSQVRYTLELSSFALPAPAKPDGAKKTPDAQPPQVAPPVQPVIFRKSDKTWEAADSHSFRAAMLSQQLSPVFEQLLVENALATRPLWFAKRRFKIGDQLDVASDALPMLLTGNATGSFTLKLESFEPVEGHPCGVFSVTGDYSRKQFPDFEGNLTDQDVTIPSGKIWFSLLYPMILKEELATIQTSKSGTQGGSLKRGQGSVGISVTRAWKRLDP
jgi:hypothetical protein